MDLLTTGAFARASRLSVKALRLYDELGLLTPAYVDPRTGYRFYDPAQLEQARLVVWLRRLDMPLAAIRQVCGLDAPAAAEQVREFWARTEADLTTRRDLAAFLIGHLSGKDDPMNEHGQTAKAVASRTEGDATADDARAAALSVRYAALSDAGLVREGNQDAAYAGGGLLAVADGFGEHGAPASTAAIEALRRVDAATLRPGDLLNALQDAVHQANEAVHELAGPTGTTLTALLWSGASLALVHIGDSRAYLLRDGDLFQITHDHTLVQSMLDEGRITAEEAASHPQRALLLRALDGAAGPAVDLRLHDARPGDRYLLCSDGLSTVVPQEEVRRVLAGRAEPAQAVRELVDLANAAGGPDNVSCAVALVGA